MTTELLILEIMSAIFVTVFYFASKTFTKNRDFRIKILERCYIFILINILCNIFCCIFIIYFTYTISSIFAYLSLSIMFVSLNFISALFTLYSLSFYYDHFKQCKTIVYLLFIPIIIQIIGVLLNLATPIWFSLADNNIPVGFVYIYNYFVLFFYTVVNLLLFSINCRKINQTKRLGVLIYPIVSIGLLVVKSFNQLNFFDIIANLLIILLLNIIMQSRQVQTDDLTGLLSRQILFEHIQELDKKKKRYILFFISLKQFKVINNHYGTNFGDKVLIAISSFLEETMRSYKEYHVYRYSGDEFAILFKDNLYGFSDSIINDIVKKFSQKWSIEGFHNKIAALYGIVSSEYLKMSKLSTVTFTDYFLKYVKAHPGKEPIVCNHAILDEVVRKEVVYYAVLNAIYKKNFTVYLQPIYDIKTKCFVSAEALVRLEDKELGIVYPNEFIPIAEERNLISKIDLIMFEKVCQILYELEEQNIVIKGISVNFSMEIFLESDLVEKISVILKKYKIKPRRIRIEVTETTVSKSYDDVRDVINQLKELGILFYLDDFGVGYSNLLSVIKIPFDYIKLDKSLADEMLTTKGIKDLVKSLCDIFSMRGFENICEGVETKEQLDLLEEYNYRYIQGYYFSKPMPAPEIIQIFKEQKNQPSMV